MRGATLPDLLLDWIAPRRCLGCDEPLPSRHEKPFCSGCGAPAPFIRNPPAVADVPVLVTGAYAGSLAAAIRRFKYQSRPDLALPLARLLFPVARRARVRLTTWVPVPLHPARLAERGFNQSALLTKHLARAFGNDVAPRALERVRDTGHQARLEREDRLANLSHAFRVRGRPPPNVCIVDDVVTTGATVRACVEVLRAEGAKVSLILALAATP